MKLHFYCIVVLLIINSFFSNVSAQVYTYTGVVVKAGSLEGNGVPYAMSSTTDTTIFKAESEIILGEGVYSSAPSNYFYNATYTGNVPGYFHAYISAPVTYAELKKVLDSGFEVTVEGKLSFRYEEKYSDGLSSLDYQIYDYQRNKMLTSFTLNPPKIGLNYYQIDVKSIPLIKSKNLSLVENQYYILEVKNSKGEIFQLRFKFIPVI